MFVTICEVGLRDGLQGESGIVEGAGRLEGVLGRALPGQVYRAGGYPAPA